MKYLLFLGNPGAEYEQTRHNAGFMIGDCLADKLAQISDNRSPNEWLKKSNYWVIRAADYWLIKPRTFMNLSGEVLKWLPDFTRADLLVVVDDLALPLGKLRFRADGSAGGHNGLKSIAAVLGDNNFQRLRFGIGDGEKVSGEKLVGKVLGKFLPEEREKLSLAIELAANAGMDWLQNGFAYCQEKYNGGNS